MTGIWRQRYLGTEAVGLFYFYCFWISAAARNVAEIVLA